MIQQFHLDIYERYHTRGLEAYRTGDMPAARRNLLKAADVLFRLAMESCGELQRVRKEKAAKLLEMAQSIDPAKNPQARGMSADARPRKAAASDNDEADTSAEKWIVSAVHDVKMDDVAGMDDVKAIIRKRVIYPFQHPSVSRKYRKQAGGGVLLYGPPGTGKTMIAKAIAAEVDATFFSVRCSDIMTKWVGEAEKNLERLFSAAREYSRAVVFLDETEAIVAKRGGDSTVMNRVIPEFLSQVDGLQGRHGGLLLLGATNRPWDIDEAALRPGRFGELIYVPLPDALARRRIIASALTGVPLGADIDVKALAARTEGYSGADLVAVCQVALDEPYEREIASGAPQCLEPDDIRKALESQKPSVTQAMLKRYDRYRQTRLGAIQ